MADPRLLRGSSGPSLASFGVPQGAARGSGAALDVRDLNVYYGQSHALQGVNLTLGQGVLSVVGRNGMGKTTLCKTIMGLEPVASGSISFNGQSLAGRAPAEIARMGIGYVPQGRRLWRSLTVDEHLKLVATPGSWTPERVYGTFPRLAERRTNGGSQLSGGEQQMLAIARALLWNPDLLLLDEPTEGLAPIIVEEIQRHLRDLKAGGLTILLVEQNFRFATDLADRVYVLGRG
ncbi:MAG: ABC transporter ATP-binding protein, partial [Pseudomonadota bacterium]